MPTPAAYFRDPARSKNFPDYFEMKVEMRLDGAGRPGLLQNPGRLASLTSEPWPVVLDAAMTQDQAPWLTSAPWPVNEAYFTDPARSEKFQDGG
ncbi:hypothetical protein [Pseudomonas phage UF_RH7]|nr:hypothetical protein [Pseudomonas phage UF_RH7]